MHNIHTEPAQQSWLEHSIFQKISFRWDVIIFALILLAAIVTRFNILEPRAMSHDESLHTYFSWKLYQDHEYVHDPMMHGPFQFHVVSWAYFLLGDSDFSARIPAVLFGIASIALLWGFRRYLGSIGVILAAGLFVISPYMLYYSRYVRNEAFVMLFGLLGMWAILRYLDTGKPSFLIVLTISASLHFATKETAFIYTAQMLLFLGLLFLKRITQKPWSNNRYRIFFLLSLVLALVLLGLAVYEVMFGGQNIAGGEPTLVEPALPGQSAGADQLLNLPFALTVLPAALGTIVLLVALFFLFRGLGTTYLRQERSLGLIIILGTLTLPQLSPLPVRFMGWAIPDTPGAIQTMTVSDVTHFLVFLIPLTLIAVIIGLWWNAKIWLINAAVFYGIFAFLYTTGFTNPSGIISGLVGSLGYWMAQQSVQRGSQPWYYYLLIQIPIYEYLIFIGSLIATIIFAKRQLHRPLPVSEEYRIDTAEIEENQPGTETRETEPITPEANNSTEDEKQDETAEIRALYLLIFWFLTSLAAYTIAGEKMPWLTVHIALPMIPLAGWGIAQLIQNIQWFQWRQRNGWLMLLSICILLLSIFSILAVLLGFNPPFQSNLREDLQATTRFLSILVITAISLWGVFRLARNWPRGELTRLILLVFLGMGGLLTMRTAFQASYVNYDEANEYLVYAHSASGVKDVMRRIEDISKRTTDGLALQFGYDDDTSWPMTWYARNYTNHRYYGGQPGKDLRELPVIVVGDSNFGKIEPVVGQAYLEFEYIRMVWPNQDYFGLTLDRIIDYITDPAMRTGLFQIWLNRDFTAYGEASGRSITLDEWSPADRMRLYIRKDVAAKLWDYATGPVSEEVVADPYEGGEVDLSADKSIGSAGSGVGQFQAPRGIALAPDNTLYVTDSNNHRIQHIDQDGKVLHSWGSFADIAVGEAPTGTFNQPWGIAVGLDGEVYVADTWNHRIQKFSPEGDFLTSWGFFGQAESPEAFWGPRDVVVDTKGHVYITDTGNKRVVVFDSDGNYVTQFGEFGLEPGNFDEPVGIAIDETGNIYVADTWNQRLQVFAETDNEFVPINSWDVAAWYGQSLENKPYITIDQRGNVFITDPEGPRVIEFDKTGQFIRYWGGFSASLDGFGVASGITTDGEGGLWVADAGNNRLLHFTLPASD